jgi:hypothetical protein
MPDSRSVKISASQSAVAHHIIDGPVTFPYAIDAHSAVSRFPDEWSHEPWSREDEARAREAAGEPPVELTAEEQAAIDEHAKAVAEANERLKAFHEKQAEKKAEADQVAADEALVKSPAPRPDPRVRRPFGRKGEPTPAELEQMRKRDQKKAAGDKAAAEKAEQDRLANSNATMTG